jgi:hypothetical protein
VIASGLLGLVTGRTMFAARPTPAPTRHLVLLNPYAMAADASWFKGDIHLASVRGVGKDLPRALGDYFRQRRYDFLAVTDMNTYTWVEEYAHRPMVGIAAIQASYPFANLLALNMDHWLPASDLQGAVDWIQKDSGLAVLAAPNSLQKPDAAKGALAVKNLFGLEIYDGRLQSLDPAQGDAVALWDSLLARGRHVYAFAGDDLLSVGDATAGSAWISVLGTVGDTSDLLRSIRQGAFYASSGATFTAFAVDGHTIRVDAPSTLTLRFIGSGGRLLAASSGGQRSYTVRGDEGYVRIEAVADNGARAWSQPFFLAWQ